MATIEKTANQLWRESGTTLTFKEWLNREKAKYMNFDGDPGVIMVNKPLNDTIQAALADARKAAGYKDRPENKTVLGLNKYVVIGAGVLVAGLIAYTVYKNWKK